MLVDHNVDPDFPLSVVEEVLDHHVNEIPTNSNNCSSLRHSTNNASVPIRVCRTYIDDGSGSKAVNGSQAGYHGFYFLDYESQMDSLLKVVGNEK